MPGNLLAITLGCRLISSQAGIVLQWTATENAAGLSPDARRLNAIDEPRAWDAEAYGFHAGHDLVADKR